MSGHGTPRLFAAPVSSARAGRLTLLGISAMFVSLLSAASLAGVALPSAAHAANAFGLTYAPSACATCHPMPAGETGVSRHAGFVVDADGTTASVEPTGTWLWPSAAFGAGFSFNPVDVGFVLGRQPFGTAWRPGFGLAYVGRTNTGALSTGDAYAPVVPADDRPLFEGVSFDGFAGRWRLDATIRAVPYFQRCGGCHVLGLTRPAAETTTLATGETITPSTVTSWAAAGIACESCHGTGKDTGTLHADAGVGIVGFGDPATQTASSGILDPQVCGQCHGHGATGEHRLDDIAVPFDSPNAYTPDETLTDFPGFHVTRLADETSTEGTRTTWFWPSGHNKAMRHATYNEWLESRHATSLARIRAAVSEGRAGATPSECLRCHSAEGYLRSAGITSAAIGLGGDIDRDRFALGCAVCHAVHAEALDPRSLRLPVAELCAGCHNAGVAPGRETTPGAPVRQPQAEMLAGYGLIDVPTGTVHMGAVTCVDCHMPLSDGRRASHRMTPLAPGDAQRWGVPAGGDSCTRCHPSLERSALQAYLDQWRAAIDYLAREASRAVANAQARREPADTTQTALYARAATDLDFVLADRGAHAHNYPYARAGLTHARFLADCVGGTLSLAPLAGKVAPYRTTVVSGTLRWGDRTGAANQQIVVEKRTSNEPSWMPRATLMTDDKGGYSLVVQPGETTYYRARFVVTDGIEIVGGPRGVSVTSSTRLTAAARGYRGRVTVLRGTVSPPQPGGRARVYVRYPGSRRFRTLTTRPLGFSGFTYRWRPRTRGRHYLYARFLGDSSHLPSTSRPRSIVIR